MTPSPQTHASPAPKRDDYRYARWCWVKIGGIYYLERRSTGEKIGQARPEGKKFHWHHYKSASFGGPMTKEDCKVALIEAEKEHK